MAKNPQVFQPKILVHQGGMGAFCPPTSPFGSAFTSPKKHKSYSSMGSAKAGYSPMTCKTGFATTTQSYNGYTGSNNQSNTLLNELYYQAFRTGFPAMLNQCQPFSERKTVIKRFICSYPGCGKMFGRNEEKTRHEKIHSGLRPYACDLCTKRFGRKDHLTQHMRTHNRSRRDGDENKRDEDNRSR